MDPYHHYQWKTMQSLKLCKKITDKINSDYITELLNIRYCPRKECKFGCLLKSKITSNLPLKYAEFNTDALNREYFYEHYRDWSAKQTIEVLKNEDDIFFVSDENRLNILDNEPDVENIRSVVFSPNSMKHLIEMFPIYKKIKVNPLNSIQEDPHVRIAGQPEDVQIARMRVLDVLDAKTDRVNMKLDVSYTDHSHIIGKGGNTIKGVMENTNCHIHFPDSNRNSNTEKSNQVSIAGTLDGVEKARWNIRRLMPLVFSFELPVTGNLQPMPDINSPCVQHVMKKYGVEVMFRQRFKLHSTLVVVKGCDWMYSKVIDAIKELFNYMCGESHNTQVKVEMSLEISPQHHSVVLGRNSNNLKTIMQQTDTQILVPDAEDPNIPNLKKSNIRISGQIENVYQARQYLIGSLPVIVMFELPSGMGCDDHEDRVSQLTQALDVSIKMRQKPRQSSLSVLIKGIERHAGNVYEACHKLLRLEGEPVKANIPESYFIPNLELYRDTGRSRAFGPLGITTSSGIYDGNKAWGTHPMFQQTSQRAIPQQCMPSLPSMSTVPRIMVPQNNFVPIFPSPDSAINSASMGSISTISSPNLSPRAPGSNSHAIMEDNYPNLTSIMNQEMSDRRAPGCERKTMEKTGRSYFPTQYRKIQAYKAMQTKPNPNESRVPTSAWSGAGLSFSTPEYVMRNIHQDEDNQQKERNAEWHSPILGPDSTTGFAVSNYLDSVSQRTTNTLMDNPIPIDLNTLLIQHGFDNYIS